MSNYLVEIKFPSGSNSYHHYETMKEVTIFLGMHKGKGWEINVYKLTKH